MVKDDLNKLKLTAKDTEGRAGWRLRTSVTDHSPEGLILALRRKKRKCCYTPNIKIR